MVGNERSVVHGEVLGAPVSPESNLGGPRGGVAKPPAVGHSIPCPAHAFLGLAGRAVRNYLLDSWSVLNLEWL